MVGEIGVPVFTVVVIAVFTIGLSWLKKKKEESKIYKAIYCWIIGIVSFTVVVFTGIIVFLVIISWSPRPPRPVARYEEFPFRLEYELSGERFVIEDVLVAEFVRSVAAHWIDPAYRVWETSFLDGSWHDDMTSWETPRGSVILTETDEVMIRFHAGHASYFMDDLEKGWFSARGYRHQMPTISIIARDERTVIAYVRPYDEFDILLEFGIEIVTWFYTEPIENHFGRR